MTYGLMVIGVNLGYLLLALFVGIFLAKFFKRLPYFRKLPTALLAVVLFLLIFFAPFYDLLIQKGIKTYYQTFKMKEQIFAYPEKNDKGNVESLGVDARYMRENSGYLSTQKDFSHFKQAYKVRNFIELYMFGSFVVKDGKIIDNYKKDMGYTRVYLNKPSIKYDNISGIEDFKARYQVLTQVEKHYFYNEKIVSFLDAKKNKLLAKGLEIDFPVKDEESKFRYKFLHWHGANGIGVNIKSSYTSGEIFRKFFRKKYRS